MKKNISLGLLFIVLGLFMSSCATTKGYEQRVNSWLGMSEASIVRGWGVPARVFNSGGRKYFIYNSSRNVYLPGTSPTYTTTFIGNTAYTSSYGGSAPQNFNFQCETTFEILNGKVASWRYKGNDCKAPEYKKNSYIDRMRIVANQTMRDKKYTRLDLNTKEKKTWFKSLTRKLWDREINKHTFVKEGLKRYPAKQYEFNFIADRLIG